MQIRDYSLPKGWFPHDSGEVSSFLSEFSEPGSPGQWSSRSAISPHAGWYYSGALAAQGAASLKPGAETIVVLGGHLSAGSPVLFAMEDAARTPFGSLPIDSAMRSILLKELNGAEDRYRDNTIEVLLPMVHYFFPKAKLLWMRLPADLGSFKAGKILSKTAQNLGVVINVLASTDLTHYGANYGFSPQGRGKTALKWMSEVNDAGFIKAVEANDSKEVLRRGEQESAACSAGAVLGAMGFAEAEGLGAARLLKYATSADIDSDRVPDSFVGYAALTFDNKNTPNLDK